MKLPFRLLIAAIITFLPVLVWNVWYLDYIDKHGKLWAWILAPVFALLATAAFLGLANAKDKPVVEGSINPFWGWFAGTLVIQVMIVLLSNT